MKRVSSESVVKDICRKTRKKYSSEEKIRIVVEGLRGGGHHTSLCLFLSSSGNSVTTGIDTIKFYRRMG